MSAALAPVRSREARGRVFRHSARDALVVGASFAHVALLVLLAALAERPGAGLASWAPAALLWGLTICWSANTLAHIHLHTRVFRARWANRGLSLWLSACSAIPQGLWAHRHRWHHAGEPSDWPRWRPGRQGAAELLAILVVVGALFAIAPVFAAAVWLPGLLFGLWLCRLQGVHEHRHGGADAPDGVSCYGRLHNLLWFNDGYHAEHHRWPGLHWTRLPDRCLDVPERSALPPVARGLGRRLSRLRQARLLCDLERLALRSRLLQRFMVATHRRAFARLLPRLPRRPQRIGVVGGGLFPRTVLALEGLVPEAELVVLEAEPSHADSARRVLAERGVEGVSFEQRFVRPDALEEVRDFDLLVVPLAFVGDKAALYAPEGPPMLVHEWLWRRRGAASARISLLLLKRLNLSYGGRPEA